MKRTELIETIPVALRELHESGLKATPYGLLGDQINRHDTDYLRRRQSVRRVLGAVGINVPEMPLGHLRPRPGAMFVALNHLEETGTVVGQMPDGQADGHFTQKYYRLTEPAMIGDE